MRTLALLLIVGTISAAKEPKTPPAPAVAPVPARLNTAELTALNAVGSRMDAIRKEYEALQKQDTEIRADACRRALNVAVCEIRQDGTLAKIETTKEEKK